MKNESFIPCDALKPFVQSIVVTETDDESTYHVLPDTGLVIGFQYKGRLFRMQDNIEIPLTVSGISGLADHRRKFKNTPHIGTVLVVFKPAGASHFFRQPLHELFRESVSLDNFMLRSEFLFLEEQLAEAATDGRRVTVVENFLTSRLRYTQPDNLVLAALALIHKAKGNIRIGELIDQLNTSQSPLEKRFRQAVGTSPKKFASIVRLKHVLLQYNPSTSLTDLGYEAGFYDQAHFIKEFKTFTGDTPENFFKGTNK